MSKYFYEIEIELLDQRVCPFKFEDPSKLLSKNAIPRDIPNECESNYFPTLLAMLVLLIHFIFF